MTVLFLYFAHLWKCVDFPLFEEKRPHVKWSPQEVNEISLYLENYLQQKKTTIAACQAAVSASRIDRGVLQHRSAENIKKKKFPT